MNFGLSLNAEDLPLSKSERNLKTEVAKLEEGFEVFKLGAASVGTLRSCREKENGRKSPGFWRSRYRSRVGKQASVLGANKRTPQNLSTVTPGNIGDHEGE